MAGPAAQTGGKVAFSVDAAAGAEKGIVRDWNRGGGSLIGTRHSEGSGHSNDNIVLHGCFSLYLEILGTQPPRTGTMTNNLSPPMDFFISTFK